MRNKELILLDLFSGIGGFHKGLHDSGFNFKKVYFSEIDKHAIANYKYNFNEAEHIGSVEYILKSGIERPNIITFGSPCQNFSMSGDRTGLNGSKSSLIESAITAISHFRPDVFIWENVKGTFSSNNSNDFWAIIKAFANTGGYGLEWQLVNTSWILPQNRERIYLIGHLTTAFPNWKRIFPIREDDPIFKEKIKSEKPQSKSEFSTSIQCKYGQRSEDTYVVVRGYGFVKDSISEICPTIRSSSFEQNTFIEGIRKFTEIECERLQGFPDNFTKYGNYDGIIKPISRTQRYKMCGNAVTAKMVELIGKKLLINYN